MAQSNTPVRLLTADDILSCNDIAEEVVEVPQWKFKDGSPGSVKIRGFTKAEQQHIRRQATDQRTDKVSTDKLEMLAFTNGVVEPHFDDIQFLNLLKKNAGAIDLVVKRVLALSGMSQDAVKSGGDAVSD
jgi:hypothetical protein